MRGAGKKAVGLYEEFHRFPPKKIGAFAPGFKIPSRVVCAGRAVDVLYRSGKVDPSTLQKPSKPIDYIHEHDDGVHLYMPRSRWVGREVATPAYVRDVQELVLLGQCLGFSFDDEVGEYVEGKVQRPYPELYAIPSGRALLVVQDKRVVEALVWGGRLGVEARGIVH